MNVGDILNNIAELLAYSPDSPMLFSSGLFWALFLLFMPLYAALRNRRKQMTIFVIAFSLFFYYKSSGWFMLLLVATSLIDWLISRKIAIVKSLVTKKCLAAISICLSLSVLCWFKYANFFLWNWNAMVQSNFQPLDIILPVGISFYTFQSISYIVDVTRGTIMPTRTWTDYLFFLSFFPALVAGPIVRADYFLPQLESDHKPTHTQIYEALWLIIIGIIKKAIIADYIAQYNDLIFDSPTAYSGFESLMGVVGYTMQIYCDFSGYSDMAIGIAMIMGFRLNINFNLPYKSKSLTEFWRRWHISLSTWLRDYIYIPLGGNRKGTVRTYLNNFLTMLIGGLWHGAAWKFVFWGAMHGVGLAVNKACRPLTARFDNRPWFNAIGFILTITYVSLLWVFFRADSWTDSCLIIQNIFTNFDPKFILPFIQARPLWLILMAIIIVTHTLPAKFHERATELFICSPWIVKLIIFLAIVQLTIELRTEDVTPFIYFRF